MVSFQRMRDELDSIEYKLPVIGKAGCLTLVVVSFFILFIIGFAIGYGVNHKGTRYNPFLKFKRFLIGGDYRPKNSSFDKIILKYVFWYKI